MLPEPFSKFSDAYKGTQTTAYMSGQEAEQSQTVQQYVKGEASSTDYGYSSVGPLADELKETEAPVNTTEPTLTDKTELAESLQKGEVTPVPTFEQRRYSADWDATQ